MSGGAPRAGGSAEERLLLGYRLRTVKIGLRATAGALAALLALPLFPAVHLKTVTGYYVLIGIAAAGASIVRFLPWERLFKAGAGIGFMYAWSIFDILLISGLVALVEGTAPGPVLLYALTTLFFAASYPLRGQVALTIFTGATYLAALQWHDPQVPAGHALLALASIFLLAYMASFLSRELMQNLTEHGRARVESDERATILSTVAKSAREMALLGHEKIFEAVVDSALRIGMDAASVCLINDDEDAYAVALCRGLPHGYEGSRRPIAGVVARAIEVRGTVIVDYSTLEDGIPELRDVFRSTIGTPLVVAGRIKGVLVAGTKLDREISAQDVEGFELIASHAGRALENATKFQELEKAYEERDHLEEQLRQAQKMEAIGQLAGGIAHDFNNLLAVIQNYADFAKEGLDDGDGRLQDIEEISKAGTRASELVRQLLTFSRRDVIRAEVLDLNEVVSKVEPVLARTIGENIKLSVNLAPEPAHVSADVGQLEQVVLNLAVNARDAMADGGKLKIEVSRVILDGPESRALPGLEPGPHVLLSVSDDGEGMDEDTVERAFEPFFTTKPAGKGTGLGLSTVYGIVRQTGGHVAVASTPGSGTRFSIYLPASKQEGDSSPERSSTPALGDAHAILVVEDEPGVREVARRILSRAGYRVTAPQTPAEAVDILRAEPSAIDLLLTDIIMPEISGTELSRELRAISPELKTVFMSGYSDEIVASNGVFQDEEAFIQKPFTREGLLLKVRETLAAVSERSGPTAGAA